MGTNEDIEHLLADMGEMRKICRLRDSITLVEAERLIRCQQNRIAALQRSWDADRIHMHDVEAKLAEIGRLYRVGAHQPGEYQGMHAEVLNHLANLFPDTDTLFDEESS